MLAERPENYGVRGALVTGLAPCALTMPCALTSPMPRHGSESRAPIGAVGASRSRGREPTDILILLSKVEDPRKTELLVTGLAPCALIAPCTLTVSSVARQPSESRTPIGARATGGYSHAVQITNVRFRRAAALQARKRGFPRAKKEPDEFNPPGSVFDLTHPTRSPKSRPGVVSPASREARLQLRDVKILRDQVVHLGRRHGPDDH